MQHLVSLDGIFNGVSNLDTSSFNPTSHKFSLITSCFPCNSIKSYYSLSLSPFLHFTAPHFQKSLLPQPATLAPSTSCKHWVGINSWGLSNLFIPPPTPSPSLPPTLTLSSWVSGCGRKYWRRGEDGGNFWSWGGHGKCWEVVEGGVLEGGVSGISTGVREGGTEGFRRCWSDKLRSRFMREEVLGVEVVEMLKKEFYVGRVMKFRGKQSEDKTY